MRSILWAVAKRPRLWPTALAAAWRMRPTGGITPPRQWVAFRIETAYGIKDGKLSDMPTEDFIHFLEWCRSFPGHVR